MIVGGDSFGSGKIRSHPKPFRHERSAFLEGEGLRGLRDQADLVIDLQSPQLLLSQVKEAWEQRELTHLEKADCKIGKSIGGSILKPLGFGSESDDALSSAIAGCWEAGKL